MVTPIPSYQRAERRPVTTEQALANYDPSLGDVMSTYAESAWFGPGSGYYDTLMLQVKTAQGEPVAQADWKNSEYYRDDIEWYEGLNSGAAKLLADESDKERVRNTILSKASGWETAAGLLYGLAAGVPEPKNASVGIATSYLFGGILGSGANSLRRLNQIYQKASRFKKYVAAGVGEGIVSAAIVEPLNQYSASVVQSDYTLADSLFNVVTSGVFGGIVGGIVSYFPDKRTAAMAMIDNTVARVEEGRPLDPQGAEAVHAAEVKTSAGNEREIFVRQRQEMEAKLTEAELNNSRIADEIASLESQRKNIILNEGDTVVTANEVFDPMPSLPKHLAGAKPRYKKSTVEFSSDVDKSLYITAQTKKSARDAEYRAFLRDEVGLSDEQINKLGSEIRAELKKLDGEDNMRPPPLYKPRSQRVETSDVNPNVKAVDEKINALRSQMTGPDKLERVKQTIKEYDDKLAAFPKDEEIVPKASKYVVDTLQAKTVYDTDFTPLSADEIKAKSDEDQLLLDSLEQLKSEVDEVPVEVRQNEQEYSLFEKLANAAYFCLTRE